MTRVQLEHVVKSASLALRQFVRALKTMDNPEGQIRMAPSDTMNETDKRGQILIEAYKLQIVVAEQSMSEAGADRVACQLARFSLIASLPKEADDNDDDDETAHYVLQLLRASYRLLNSGAMDCQGFHAAIVVALDFLKTSRVVEKKEKEFREARRHLLSLIKGRKTHSDTLQSTRERFFILLGRLFIPSECDETGNVDDNDEQKGNSNQDNDPKSNNKDPSWFVKCSCIRRAGSTL